MQECVFRLAADRGAPSPLYEALSSQRMQPLFDVGARTTIDEAAEPEDLAENGCVLQQLLFLRWKAVEPRGDDALQRLGHWQVLSLTSLKRHCRVLLGIERITTRSREQRVLKSRIEQRLPEQRAEETGRLLFRKRRQRQRRRVER